VSPAPGPIASKTPKSLTSPGDTLPGCSSPAPFHSGKNAEMISSGHRMSSILPFLLNDTIWTDLFETKLNSGLCFGRQHL
jgi:hypothetical protein